jgi:hypothetical protein
LRAAAVVRSLVIAGSLLVSSLASATPVVEWHPGVSLAAGADDNLLFNGQGGDRVGRAEGRLRMKAKDHLWAATLDGEVSLYAFQVHSRYVPLGELTGGFTDHVTRDDTLHAHLRMRGSDDPLALAQVGLLGSDGTTLGFRSSFDWDHQITPRWNLISTTSFDGVHRFDPAFSDKSGEAAGLSLKPRYRLTRDLALETGLEGRLFLGQGVAGKSVGLLPGVEYRLTRRTYLEAQVGAALFNDTTGSVPIPLARASLNWEGRRIGFQVVAAQDLGVPNGRAGVLENQFAEGTFRYDLADWVMTLRGGLYRTLSSPRDQNWTPAYGAEAGASYHLAPLIWAGISALRFERVSTQIEPGMARDAVYLHFDFGELRP